MGYNQVWNMTLNEDWKFWENEYEKEFNKEHPDHYALRDILEELAKLEEKENRQIPERDILQINNDNQTPNK